LRMPPRGMKKVLKETTPAKLSGKGKFRGFVDGNGRKLKGLHPALTERIFSAGVLPTIAKYGSVKRSGWRGKGGGRRRGAAVDSQLSSAVNKGKSKPTKGQYTLTKLALAALAEHKLEPVVSQRAVCDTRRRLGTAIDILCYDSVNNKLVVVELKTGFSGSKLAAAQRNGKNCKMCEPLDKATDNVLNRHFAQLTVARALFALEKQTILAVNNLGISAEIGAALLYVNDEMTELYYLSNWWIRREKNLLKNLNF